VAGVPGSVNTPEEERTRLAEHRVRLKEAGLKDDEIKRISTLWNPSTSSFKKRSRAPNG
jgi:hypothetical protein